MTVTRHPTGQDLVCLVCHKQAQDIDHVQNRGSGGSKARDVPENKVPLCRECHELKTLGYIETEIFTNDGGGLSYRWKRELASDTTDAPWIYTPVEVSQRYKCLVGRLSNGAEGEGDTRVPTGSASGQPEVPSSASSLKEESAPVLSAAAEEQGRGSDSVELSIPETESSAAAPSAGRDPDDANLGYDTSLTHDERVAIAKDIHDVEWHRQWRAGDTANQWRAELGEEAEQYLSDFGYVELSLANIMRVCEAIPLAFRNAALRFSHHVVVAGENLEDVEMHLAECVENGWSVAEFRRQVKGTKPKVKRWTLEELRDLIHDARLWEKLDAASTPEDFLKWLDEEVRLGEQG